MAVSQGDRLKNPCMLWMWNTLVAIQPPIRAPAMPMRQVRMRPCCRFPGISILAMRPAMRPRTIQAMMLMTDFLGSCSERAAVVSDAFSRRVPPAQSGCKQKTPGPQGCIRRNIADAATGVRSNTLRLRAFSRRAKSIPPGITRVIATVTETAPTFRTPRTAPAKCLPQKAAGRARFSSCDDGLHAAPPRATDGSERSRRRSVQLAEDCLSECGRLRESCAVAERIAAEDVDDPLTGLDAGFITAAGRLVADAGEGNRRRARALLDRCQLGLPAAVS